MSSDYPRTLLLIGAGKMGSALMRSWLTAGMPKKTLTAVDTASSVKDVLHSLDDVKKTPDCIVIAVKPQSLNTLLPEVRAKFGDKPLYISIAAGKPVAYFQQHLGNKAAIVRTMPNTPAIIGKGITALYANKKTSVAQKKVAASLLQAAGKIVWLKKEPLMDAVTAISGSGPAYVFLFLESMIAAAKLQGLPENTARQLVVETLIGSVALAGASKESLSRLRENVTSKGGTTEAALSILMKDDSFQSLLAKAVDAAVKRAKELA